ncbi:hypothetical protein TNCV_2692951 [Trichonephila clavipes]|uniref:Uncharacterized protein n=1 Tax=Trichonephila clavipes TaxID=2585209 RepID=A0A8X6VZ36_TRICX|nr:hypothetical protein TNCV_2692951 [Trichonephila clavipes]
MRNCSRCIRPRKDNHKTFDATNSIAGLSIRRLGWAPRGQDKLDLIRFFVISFDLPVPKGSVDLHPVPERGIGRLEAGQSKAEEARWLKGTRKLSPG